MDHSEFKKWRRARYRTQDEAAEAMEVDRMTVNRWELGVTSPPGRLLELACKGLDLEREAEHSRISDFPNA